MDLQSQDRAYRIGQVPLLDNAISPLLVLIYIDEQKEQVSVFRLVAKGTVEEVQVLMSIAPPLIISLHLLILTRSYT